MALFFSIWVLYAKLIEILFAFTDRSKQLIEPISSRMITFGKW